MKNFKRALTLILAISLTLNCITMTAFAVEDQPEEQVEELPTSGTTGDCTWSLDGTTLTISGKGAMADYDVYESPFFETSIESVIIGDGVSHIGKGAFEWCSKLTDVTIGSSVESIGDFAFAQCASIEKITIPASVISLGEGVFDCCYGLESITVESGNPTYFSKDNCLIEKATETLYLGCKNSIIPDDGSVTCIGAGAFYGCSSLISITIPEGVTSIGDWAFYDCENLISINIPEGVTSIGASAFNDCDYLDGVIIPDSVKSIGESAFYWSCTLICNEGSYAWQYAINNDLVHVGYTESGTTGDLTWQRVGTELTITGAGAMPNYDYYESPHPWDYYITKVTIGDEITSIGNGAFYALTNMTDITIGNSVTSIGDNAFYFCSAMENISIPTGVTSIGERAFETCLNLKNITIPAGVTSIDNSIFVGCPRLESITVESNNPNYYSSGNCIIEKETMTLILGCKNSIIPAGVTRIGDCSFSGCEGLTGIVIPDSVTGIGNYAFDGCYGLTSLIIPDSVTEIGEYAFFFCENLESIIIPSSVTAIGYDAFGECEKLTIYCDYDSYARTYAEENRIAYKLISGPTGECTWSLDGTTLTISGEGSMEDYEAGTMPWGTEIENVFISDGVTHISQSAFIDCTNLKAVIIPDSVETIGIDAFKNCPKLYIYTSSDTVKDYAESKNITVIKDTPATVTTGNCTYYWYDGDVIITGKGEMTDYSETTSPFGSSVKQVIIGGGVTGIGDYAFYGCENLAGVVIPDNIKHIGDNAFPETGTVIICNEDSYAWNYAVENGIEHVKYTESCEEGDLTWQRVGTELTISGTGEIANYIDLSKPWGKYITRVTICDGITKICEHAFISHNSLRSIVIPSSVTSINSRAFSSCNNLVDITIDSENTKYFSKGNCIIERVNNDKEVIIIGCKSSTIPVDERVVSIEADAFLWCTGLTELTIPDNIREIGITAFEGCDNLTIYCGMNSAAHEYAIKYGKAYKLLYGTSGECSWKLDGTVLTISGEGAMGNYDSVSNKAPWGTSITEVIIEDGVTSIGDYAFSNCESLTEIVIPGSLTTLGSYAFDSCSNLAVIITLGDIETIDPNAITNCDKLKIFTSGDTVYDYAASNAIPVTKATPTIGTTGDCTYYLFGIDAIITGKGKMADYDYIVESPFNNASINRAIIGNGVTHIGKRAFDSCLSLTDITFGNSVSSIGEAAFYDCKGLMNITLPDSLRLIEAEAFLGCDECESIVIPDGVTMIGDEAFRYCRKLSSIIIPNGVTSIGNHAFSYCENLLSITIPASVISIGEGALDDCNKLESITVESENPKYLGSGNCLIEIETKTLLKGCTNSVIPSDGSVTCIGARAFYDCYELIDITIPDKITSIGKEAFNYCSNMNSIIIPESVTSIGETAFYWRCTLICKKDGYAWNYAIENNYPHIAFSENGEAEGLTWQRNGTELIISGTGEIPDDYYESLQSFAKFITKLTIDSEITSIGHSAFLGLESLTDVTIGNGVTTIGEGAFFECGRLTDVTIGNSVSSIEGYAFRECCSLENINFPNSLKSIGEEAFANCYSLKSIAIPAGVTSIGSKAFIGCGGLESITVASENTKYLGSGNCLIEISTKTLLQGSNNSVIPNDGSVTSIGEDAFVKCNSLESVNFPNSVTSIGEEAFADCSSLKSITIPAGVTSIGSYAFSGCGGLESITVASENTMYLGSGNCLIEKESNTLLFGCKNSVIPSDGKVTSIENYAFVNCNDLTNITIPDIITSIADNAFNNCDNLTFTCKKSSAAYAYAQKYSIPVVLIAPKAKEVSLTLDSDININFYMDLPEDADPATEMVFTIGGREVTGVKKTNENGTYFSCPVNALEMNETVKAKYTYDGEEYTQEYSVAQYLQSILDGNFDASLKTLAKKIANYGYYTQLYLQNLHPNSVTIGEGGYAAISKYTDADINVAAADLTDTFETPEATEFFSLNGRSLQFDSATALNYYVTVKNGSEPTATAVTTATDKNKAVDIKQYSGRVYIITVQDIYATELADDIKVTIKDGANTLELTSSVLDCCGAIIAAHNADAKTEADNLAINSIVSFYEYYEAAMAYKEK